MMRSRISFAPAPVRSVTGICVLLPRSFAPCRDNNDRFALYFLDVTRSMFFICGALIGNEPSRRYCEIACLPAITSDFSSLNLLTASLEASEYIDEYIKSPIPFVIPFISLAIVFPVISLAFGYSPNLSLYPNENCCQSHAMLTALFLIRQTAYCISLNKSYNSLSYSISYRIVFVIFIVIYNQLH